jgi:hypothetical protein
MEPFISIIYKSDDKIEMPTTESDKIANGPAQPFTGV